MRGVLPPAGNPVSLRSENALQLEHRVQLEFSGYHTTWVDSGTSALALALLTAKQARTDIAKPEVIIPAYCCPDLVAAAVHAGVKPIAVDISPNDPAYKLDNLTTALNQNTLAVIAVNFLGVRESLAELRVLLTKHPAVFLIEDNAQWFPDESETGSLAGDFVVFSFGRGKPVSLLGGGLLLSKLSSALAPCSRAQQGQLAQYKTKFKFLAYNLLLLPQAYQLLARNPLIKLGETHYHPLLQIAAMDSYRHHLLAENIRAYRASRHITAALAAEYDRILATHNVSNQLLAVNSTRCARLLRYPLLLETPEQRDKLLAALTQQGLGATAMYQKPLEEIDRMMPMITTGNSDNARSFAARLITLPLHSGVTKKHCELIASCIALLN
jgi:dTDP-4-amino-4,6-dideoxygalactose transaminase